MPLQFSRDPARYNPYSDVITFFAMDAETMVMCNVSRESLEYLENGSCLTETQLIAAFMKHRDWIRRIVSEHHERRSSVAHALVKTDFVDRPEMLEGADRASVRSRP
jgi:hypothetical protein